MQTDPMKWFFIQFYLKTNHEESTINLLLNPIINIM
jgi:hypothetical protein